MSDLAFPLSQERIDELAPQLDTSLAQLGQQINYQIAQINDYISSTDRFINRARAAAEVLDKHFVLQCTAVIAEKQLLPLYGQAYLQPNLGRFRLVFGHSTIQGLRGSNEDAHAVFEADRKDQRFTVAAVFDGHAGDEAAIYCGENYRRVVEDCEMFPYSLEATLRLSFKLLDKEVVLKQLTSGCTAVSAIFDYQTNTLYAANAGDARCVCGTREAVFEATHDHKPDKLGERARIEAHGSFVSTMSAVPRVNGVLAVSRSIGDEEYKQFGVISEPDCYYYFVDDLLYCVVACDGVFDVLNNYQLDVIIRSCLDLPPPSQGYRFYGKVGEKERENFEKTAKMLNAVAKLYFKGDYESADQQIMDKMGTAGADFNMCALPTTQMPVEDRVATMITRISFLMGSYDNVTCLFGLVVK